MPKPISHSPQWAETLSLQALGHILGDGETMERFLSLTGLDAEGLKASLPSPPFLAAVLDYILADEPLLLAFAEAQGINPHDIMKAQTLLAGRPALYEP
jgi:Protein of unknown function (DUF3572)